VPLRLPPQRNQITGGGGGGTKKLVGYNPWTKGNPHSVPGMVGLRNHLTNRRRGGLNRGDGFGRRSSSGSSRIQERHISKNNTGLEARNVPRKGGEKEALGRGDGGAILAVQNYVDE